MKKSMILFILVFGFGSCFGQETDVKSPVRQVVTTFFEGFHKGDTLLMRSVMAENTVMQTTFTDKEGNIRLTDGNANQLLMAIANRPSDQVWEERLLAYHVQMDGTLAHVWTPYEFWLNGTFSHCGANAFTLVKTSAGWKIIHLIDSRRTSDCQS